MTNAELRIAIAEAIGLEDICDSERGLVATRPRLMSTFPVPLPDWPENTDDALALESMLDYFGLADQYLQHLSIAVGTADKDDAAIFQFVNASPRLPSEAALATLLASDFSSLAISALSEA